VVVDRLYVNKEKKRDNRGRDILWLDDKGEIRDGGILLGG
jgi:hypothetical protein